MAEVNKVVYGDDTLIDLTSDTVTEDSLKLGETAHDAAGRSITGTWNPTSGADATIYASDHVSLGRKAGTTVGTNSIAYGLNIEASGQYSHAEGNGSTASGYVSHAEGNETTASGTDSHSEGSNTTASGYGSHAEGEYTTASGDCSHAQGNCTEASGESSHAEGSSTTASGLVSHAEGCYTIAGSFAQHVEGMYNILDENDTYAHIVGNGTSTTKSNAYTLDWEGNGVFAGNVTAKNITSLSSTIANAEDNGYLPKDGVSSMSNVELTEEVDTLSNEKANNGSSAYSSSKAYVVGDDCTYNGKLYSCISDCQNVAPPNTTYWSEVTLSTVNNNLGILIPNYANAQTKYNNITVTDQTTITINESGLYFIHLNNTGSTDVSNAKCFIDGCKVLTDYLGVPYNANSIQVYIKKNSLISFSDTCSRLMFSLIKV